MILTVDGQKQKIGRDRAVTLELGPTFTWRIDNNADQIEHVPNGKRLHEVLIRD